MRKTVPPIRVFDSESVTVWYHPDTKIVHQQFHRFVYGRAFRDALNAGAEAMQTYGAQKWLSDDRQNGPLGHRDLEWAEGDWFPRVQAAGWKYWAIVPPQAGHGQVRTQETAQAPTERGVTTKLFSNPREAMAWLERQ